MVSNRKQHDGAGRDGRWTRTPGVITGLLFISFLTACERLTLPPRPGAVAPGSVFERHHRVWILRESTRERNWYENGALATDGSLSQGARDGTWRWYAPDGVTITTEGRYIMGRRTGEWIHRDDAGVVYAVIRYAAEPADPELTAVSLEIGNENGPMERFYPDGRRELSGAFRAGRFHGPFKRYFRNGRVEYEGEYQNGLKEGIWHVYRDDGSHLRDETYRRGRVHGSFLIFDSRSRLDYEAQYEDGILKSERNMMASGVTSP